MQWLHEFPFILIIPGVLLGIIAALVVGWKMFPIQNKALEGLVETQRSHLKDQETRYQEMKSERDSYRDQLHSCRNEQQGQELKIAELENQPNLQSIKLLLESQSAAMQSLGRMLEKHTADDAEVFGKIKIALDEVPVAMREQQDHFDKRQAAMLEPVKMMCEQITGYMKKQTK